jgi:hypothetical protein
MGEGVGNAKGKRKEWEGEREENEMKDNDAEEVSRWTSFWFEVGAVLAALNQKESERSRKADNASLGSTGLSTLHAASLIDYLL